MSAMQGAPSTPYGGILGLWPENASLLTYLAGRFSRATGNCSDAQCVAEQTSRDVLRERSENAKLAIDMASAFFNRGSKAIYGWTLLNQQSFASVFLVYGQYVLSWLQPKLAEDRECRCSPFGRLQILSGTMSGSMPETLFSLPDGPELKSSSDSDLMIELGPVHWITADLNQPTTVPGPGKAGASPRPASSVPRLLIEETDNPGFVRVLQEPCDSCKHQDPLPFRSDSVRRLMDAFYRLTHPWAQQSTAGPSAATVEPPSSVILFENQTETVHELIKKVFGGRQTTEADQPGRQTTEVDHVACLYVSAWWPSDEFFERSRNNDWPPKATRDDIRQFGVHLVPTGAKGSPTEQSEWRVSFSRSELVTTSHLTDTQANSLVVFKTSKSAMGEQGKTVKSYFAKTALFWLCQDMPADAWTGAVQGAERIITFLEKAVKACCLPAFFCADINLLKSTDMIERKEMLKTLDSMRNNMTNLMMQNTLIGATRSNSLESQTSPVTERQQRVCLVRFMIRAIVSSRCEDRSKTARYLSALLYSAAEEDPIATLHSERQLLQTDLLKVFTMAPADVRAKMRRIPSGDGGFVWDAAPLMSLLTADDLKRLLGDPDAVRAWLRRQHQLPETERPPGLSADLRSPRDLCDLLLNIPLLRRVLRETGNKMSVESNGHLLGLPWEAIDLPPFEDKVVPILEHRNLSRVGHLLSQGLNGWKVSTRFNRFLAGLKKHLNDPETRAEYNRLRTRLPDPWRVRPCMLRGNR